MTESTTAKDLLTPAASRPVIPGYGVPEGDEGLLSWEHVTQRLTDAKNVWVSTASADGQPHAVPVWAILIDGTLYFSVGPRSARNIAANPKVNVHSEDGSDVFIIEGTASILRNPSSELSKAMDDAFAAKYDFRPSSEGTDAVGEGFFTLHPTVAYAWTAFPTDATRWTFA
ncbi:MAG TPA: pyridoxamine 5'-phosphate oxidase family protein [Thermomicrobiales bacterium]|nr:pyridoxamine 5'-phosphate oxidase family protein [Thermomicrobiales bacterium]